MDDSCGPVEELLRMLARAAHSGQHPICAHARETIEVAQSRVNAAGPFDDDREERAVKEYVFLTEAFPGIDNEASEIVAEDAVAFVRQAVQRACIHPKVVSDDERRFVVEKLLPLLQSTRALLEGTEDRSTSRGQLSRE